MKTDKTPDHYYRHGLTCEQQMKSVFGAEAVAIFFKISAFKYRFRAGYKGDIVADINKALHCEQLATEFDELAEAERRQLDETFK